MVLQSTLARIFLLVVFGLADALDFPATIEVDIVFPRNASYSNLTEMPVVFAIQNAEAAFDFGYSLRWKLHLDNRSAEFPLVTSHTLYESGDREPPAAAFDDIWYAGSLLHPSTRMYPGAYMLKWEWTMVTCTQSDTTTTIQPGGSSASGTIRFSVAEEGGNGKSVSLSDECPEYSDRLTARKATNTGCPIMTSKEPKDDPNPCRAKMTKEVEKCIMSNLTESYDKAVCDNAQKAWANDADDAGSLVSRPLGGMTMALFTLCATTLASFL